MKRLLLLITLLCTLSAQAQTYWDGTADKNFPGEGTQADPYLISTPEQLAGLVERTNVEKEDFAGKYIKPGEEVVYVTERCVMKMIDGKMTITEIAPGIDLHTQILDMMDFAPMIPEGGPKLMDERIFRDEPMGLK